MKKIVEKRTVLLLLLGVMIGAEGCSAQEFRGFYGNDYPPAQVAKRTVFKRDLRRFDYPAPTSGLFNYYGSGGYYAGGYSSQLFRGFYGNTIPQPSVIINILPAGAQPATGSNNYTYYNGTGNMRYNRNNFDPYNQTGGNGYPQLPANAVRRKIDGTWYYEMDGNYYRADYFDNTGNNNLTPNSRGGNNYFSVEEGNNIFMPSQARNGNGYYTNTSRPLTDANYAARGNEYTDRTYEKNSKKSNRLMWKQEQQAIEAENAQLKQKLQQREADKKAEAQAEADRRAEADMYSDLKIGDTVEKIPGNSKEVTIDSMKTYLSPGNIFYRKVNGKYKVVGRQ